MFARRDVKRSAGDVANLLESLTFFDLLAAERILSYRRVMNRDQQHQLKQHLPALAVATGLVGTLLVAWIGAERLQTLWLGNMLTVTVGILLQRKVVDREDSVGLLNTPFHLSHDTEVFDRYQLFSQQMLRISQRRNVVFRELALQTLDEMVATCTSIGKGLILFSETETWRIAYERLLREPTVFNYRSVALVRHPQYWQDAAGTGSMQLNFQLVEQQIVAIERIVIIADELWPKAQDLPVEELRQWIHEQSAHGIWIRLARISDLRQEPELLRDMGIYGQIAVGTQELAADNLRTHRFLLNFDLHALREAERQWEKLGVYSIAYKELLEQFRLHE